MFGGKNGLNRGVCPHPQDYFGNDDLKYDLRVKLGH